MAPRGAGKRGRSSRHAREQRPSAPSGREPAAFESAAAVVVVVAECAQPQAGLHLARGSRGWLGLQSDPPPAAGAPLSEG